LPDFTISAVRHKLGEGFRLTRKREPIAEIRRGQER
jgi:hypothetical protein